MKLKYGVHVFILIKLFTNLILRKEYEKATKYYTIFYTTYSMKWNFFLNSAIHLTPPYMVSRLSSNYVDFCTWKLREYYVNLIYNWIIVIYIIIYQNILHVPLYFSIFSLWIAWDIEDIQSYWYALCIRVSINISSKIQFISFFFLSFFFMWAGTLHHFIKAMTGSQSPNTP